MTQKDMKQWVKERDEAIRSLSVYEFKVFYLKWCKRGMYRYEEMPEDRVIELSLYKMLYHLKDSTPEEKKTAKDWLIEHGSNTDI